MFYENKFVFVDAAGKVYWQIKFCLCMGNKRKNYIIISDNIFEAQLEWKRKKHFQDFRIFFAWYFSISLLPVAKKCVTLVWRHLLYDLTITRTKAVTEWIKPKIINAKSQGLLTLPSGITYYFGHYDTYWYGA